MSLTKKIPNPVNLSAIFGPIPFTAEIEESIDSFLESFALNKVSYFKEFFKYILCEELEDVDISSIEDAEFRHIGGPIILNSLDEV